MIQRLITDSLAADSIAAAVRAPIAEPVPGADFPTADSMPLDGAQGGASDFLERMEFSVRQNADFVWSLLGALVLLFAGYLLAKLVEKGTERFLRRIQLNRMLERGGVMQAVERSGSHMNPTRVIANLIFWLVMFMVMVVAANALGLESLADVFSQMVSYIPAVIAAIVIILVGIVLGSFVGGLIMASAGGIHGGPTLARVGRAGVIVLAVFMALQELGIAADLVTTAFAILFGAVALALALSFGLGNRDLAGEITREWYDRYRDERDAIDRDNEAEELADDLEDQNVLAAGSAEPPRRKR